MYGLLSAVTFRRVAVDPAVELVETLTKLDEAQSRSTDIDEFERIAREIRRVVNVAAAGPNLRALLRSFAGLVPAAARFSIVDAMEDERAATSAEVQAVRSRDPEAAAAATLDHIAMTARNAIAALRRRGVIAGDDVDRDERSANLELVRRMSGRGRTS
jgi:hypothetical protein